MALDPATTYYFEIAPLTGDSIFEMNSSRTGTYTGGTAFRGSNAGVIGTGVNPLAGDFIFHANLEAKIATAPTTVAYWNFEEGTPNTYAPYARTSVGQYQGSIFDQSGNANHLSVWSGSWHWYRPQTPAASTPQTGAANTLSIQNAGNFPAVSALGTSLTSWSPTAWTIEATIRPDDATNGSQSIIGRDSRGAFAADPTLAALYFTVLPSGGLRFMFTDAAGNNWNLVSAANTLQDAKWHAVAATSDGKTLSLYRKNITNNEATYSLLGTLDISASANPALSTGSGDGGDWDAGVFTLARGLYNGGHADRFFGHIDDVRFSNGALAPANFLYNAPLLTFAAWINSYPGVGAANGFDDDPDGDGLPNGIEIILGSAPHLANQGLRNIAKLGSTFTFQHPRNSAALGDVTSGYRWSLDLATWNPSGASHSGTTVAFATAPDMPQPGTTTVTATITGSQPARLFVELIATRP